MPFESRGWVFGHKLSNEDIAEIKGVRDVAMETNFGTTLAANGFWWKIRTWGFRIKDGLFSVNPAPVSRSLWIRTCGDRNCPRRSTVRLGIDTLIANILVSVVLWPMHRRYCSHPCWCVCVCAFVKELWMDCHEVLGGDDYNTWNSWLDFGWCWFAAAVFLRHMSLSCHLWSYDLIPA